MADKNSSQEHQQTTDTGNSLQFKILIAVLALSVLSLILKAAGVF
jgi:hypothetical protein